MGLRDLLPHHLVYVVEFAPQPGTNARERRVVAVAALRPPSRATSRNNLRSSQPISILQK